MRRAFTITNRWECLIGSWKISRNHLTGCQILRECCGSIRGVTDGPLEMWAGHQPEQCVLSFSLCPPEPVTLKLPPWVMVWCLELQLTSLGCFVSQHVPDRWQRCCYDSSGTLCVAIHYRHLGLGGSKKKHTRWFTGTLGRCHNGTGSLEGWKHCILIHVVC